MSLPRPPGPIATLDHPVAVSIPFRVREGFRVMAALARVQGAYYLLTGVWPLIAPHSFQGVTGWKLDFWLAQTVGALLAITGSVLILSARRTVIPGEIALIGGLQAVALGVVDLYCVTLPRTTGMYLLDAGVEFFFAAVWAWGWRHRRRIRPRIRDPRA